MDAKPFDIEAQAHAINQCDPEPLRRPLNPPQAYPMHALGNLLGNAAMRIKESVQAPDALCGQSILTAASLAVQGLADIEIDGRIEPLSLWAVTVGESGERKSGVYSWALRTHKEFEKEQNQKYQDDLKAYKIEQSAYETACKKVTNNGSKNTKKLDIYHDIKNVGDEPIPPLYPYILLEEPTLEGAHKLLIHGQPSIGLFSDEGAEFLGGHAMNKDNRAKSAASFSKLWDMGEFSRVRAGDGAGKYYGKRMAMHLMIQPVIAESQLCDEVLIGQGFLARCLLAWPVSTIGSRLYLACDLTADRDMNLYWDRVRLLLGIKPSLRDDTLNELNPRRLTLTPEARAAFKAVHDATERATLNDYVNVKAWASKGASQALRIAGVLTLFENPTANQIEVEALDRAILLTDYYLSEAARLSGVALIPPEIRAAESLLDWIHKKKKRVVYSGEIIQFGPNLLRNNTALKKAIEPLVQSGHLMPIESGKVIDGKHRKQAWQVFGFS